MKPLALLAAAAMITPAVLAHGAAQPRYHVSEIHAPAELRANCLSTLAQSVHGATINDLGIASANFNCYIEFVPDGPFPYANQQYHAFIGANWFGSQALPDGAQSYAARINNLGQVFGGDNAPTLLGTRWSLSGGVEHLFDAPECEGLNINGAQGGNSRYVVGWGLRFDPDLGPPFDTLCLTNYWLIRNPEGTVVQGPRNGSALDINAWHMAVGTSNESAIAMNVPTGETRVLHAGTVGVHGAIPVDINDLGQAAGYSYTYINEPDVPSCTRNTALRWDRDGSEATLPHLPGAISSRAQSIGYSDEVVGDSGAGNYCPNVNYQNERAVIWRGNRAVDLNDAIPRHLDITLVYASSINRRGQILATGFANADPVSVCPNFTFDPDTQQQVVQLLACRNTRVFVLTPVGR